MLLLSCEGSSSKTMFLVWTGQSWGTSNRNRHKRLCRRESVTGDLKECREGPAVSPSPRLPVSSLHLTVGDMCVLGGQRGTSVVRAWYERGTSADYRRYDRGIRTIIPHTHDACRLAAPRLPRRDRAASSLVPGLRAAASRARHRRVARLWEPQRPQPPGLHAAERTDAAAAGPAGDRVPSVHRPCSSSGVQLQHPPREGAVTRSDHRPFPGEAVHPPEADMPGDFGGGGGGRGGFGVDGA